MASGGTILASGPHWQVVKIKYGPPRLHFYCLNCGHRISRQAHRASVQWHHLYQSGPDAQCSRHAICWCGCDNASGPKYAEQAKAYRKLEYWDLEIQKERLYGNKKRN